MFKKFGHFLRKRLLFVVFIGFILGVIVAFYSHKAVEATSTNQFCEVCHVHPHVFESWKLSPHYDTRSGIQVGCVECHLPPKGEGYMKEKIRLGIKDVYGFLFKDSADFNWEGKRTVEMAQHFTFQSSCVGCHTNLFPRNLSKEGMEAHLYYSMNEKDLLCLNCHIDVGHYDPNRVHSTNVNFGSGVAINQEVYTEPAVVSTHENFTETIPGSVVSFNMIAIPGGSFQMGSPDSEPMRSSDEGPVRTVNVSPFFMAEVEVTWNEFLVFYTQTAAEGRSTDTEGSRLSAEVDAITGPTPPYGQPDQNWGMGDRPAITMSYHAAETYCRWLSQVTGKTYRLPTEAEWEYAARGGTQTPYFFEGNPKDFTDGGFFRKRKTEIDNFVVYNANSLLRTQRPEKVDANPFGLKNMLGNAAEYVADWYAPDAYSMLQDGATDPKGPESGTERVVRGGYFRSDAANVRSAARDYTRTEAWLKSDPQMPKSIWWLSDCNYISFRVVCEFDDKTGN
ncbi:MAG: SUMF1/EgtB/PvdO family nonheme iron enzyme [Bacteroidota bacterium]